MTNRYVDHLLVLPEDDANRQLVNGFQLSLRINPRCIQVLPSAGGWRNALAALENPGHIKGLQTYP